MGLLNGDEARAGKKSKKGKWSLKSLFASNLRSMTLPRNPSELAPGQHTPSSSPQAAAPAAGTLPLPATPPAARQPASPEAAAGPAASPASPPAAAAGAVGSSEEDLGLAGRGLVVQVIQARRLRAADSNGLSDPYVIVKVSQARQAGGRAAGGQAGREGGNSVEGRKARITHYQRQ
jgi:hypothetical protein